VEEGGTLRRGGGAAVGEKSGEVSALGKSDRVVL
jgi:hypothetical protein